MPSLHSPQNVNSEFSPTSLGLVGRRPDAASLHVQTSADQSHALIAPENILGHDLNPPEGSNDHMSYLDPASFLALDSQMNASEALDDRFAWYLASDLMSDTLTR